MALASALADLTTETRNARPALVMALQLAIQALPVRCHHTAEQFSFSLPDKPPERVESHPEFSSISPVFRESADDSIPVCAMRNVFPVIDHDTDIDSVFVSNGN